MPPHVHTQTFRVVMSEVDVAQIHFTAVYRWMDRGFSEWLAEIGHPFTQILEEGPGIPIVDSRCRFLGRILLDDLITLRTEVGGIGRTSFRTRHDLHARRRDRRARRARPRLRQPRDARAGARCPDWLRERRVARAGRAVRRHLAGTASVASPPGE